MISKISIVKCRDYDPELVFAGVKKAVDLLGGIASFVKPKARVLVKPNLLMAKPPEFGIDTHPEVVRSVVKILKEINCEIYIGDGPSVWGNQVEDVDEVYAKSGIKKVSQEEDVQLVRFDKKRWRGKFPLTTWLDVCEALVSVPKFKTHNFTVLTAGIKNLYGLIPGTFKTEIHKNYYLQEDFAKILVDIYEEARPQLTVVDGIVAMEADGPATGGKLRNAGLLLAGKDCVAIDSILAVIMGLFPEDILTNKEAAKRGLGTMDIASIQILGERLENALGKPFIMPGATFAKNFPRPIIEIAKKLIRFLPKTERKKCILCRACVDACPKKAISVHDDHIVFDYSRCISCFCCQEACPASAIKVKKSLFSKIIGF